MKAKQTRTVCASNNLLMNKSHLQTASVITCDAMAMCHERSRVSETRHEVRTITIDTVVNEADRSAPAKARNKQSLRLRKPMTPDRALPALRCVCCRLSGILAGRSLALSARLASLSRPAAGRSPAAHHFN